MTALNKVINTKPDHVNAYKLLGDLYGQRTLWTNGWRFELKQPETAIKAYKKAITLNPNNGNMYLKLASLYEDLDRKEEAIDMYENIRKVEPNNISALLALGLIFNSMGHKGKAIEVYKQAIRLQPNNADLYLKLANIYSFMRFYYTDYEKTFTPSDLTLIDHDKAIEAYIKATDIEPDSQIAYFGLGIIYLKKEQHQKAIDCFKKGFPFDNFSAQIELYEKLRLNNYHKEAGKALQRAFIIKPTLDNINSYKECLYSLGNLRSGYTKTIIQLYEKVLKIEPNDADIYRLLASCYNNLAWKYKDNKYRQKLHFPRKYC